MTENQDLPEVEVPDAGEFDLNSWIDGHHTYPEYVVKVHLNKAAVVESNKLLTEIEKLESEEALTAKDRESFAKGASLGEKHPDFEAVAKRAAAIKAKRKERAEILDKAKDSAMKIVLRKPEVHEDDEGGNAFDQVRREMAEKYPEHAEGLNSADSEARSELFQENPGMAHEQITALFHLMIASITTAKGVTVERGGKLTRATISNLIKRLENSDINKVQMNLNLALSGADLREEQIDAGFPG